MPLRIRIVYKSNPATQNPNAEAIANNHDLLTQILACLPVKSLLRFKSVSKGWYALISNPQFSRRVFPHFVSGLFLVSSVILLKNNVFVSPKPEFVPLTDKSMKNAPSLTFLHGCMRLRMVQSCHGLFLCCGDFETLRSKHDYFIYNPTTKQSVRLPRIPKQLRRKICAGSLAFDPAKSSHYEVVCVQNADKEKDFGEHLVYDSAFDVYRIVIYSSRTGSWRVSGSPFIAHRMTPFSGGVFCNGVIHWINACNLDASLYFDVEGEKLEKLPMPMIPQGRREEERHLGYFGESRDHLHLIQLYETQLTQFDVYEMEKDYSGWLVKYHVDLDAVTAAFPEMIIPSSGLMNGYAFVIVCVIREENDEESYMVLRVPGKAIRYNFKDGSFKKICDCAPDYNDDEGLPFQAPFITYVAYQFNPTLFHLNGI